MKLVPIIPLTAIVASIDNILVCSGGRFSFSQVLARPNVCIRSFILSVFDFIAVMYTVTNGRKLEKFVIYT